MFDLVNVNNNNNNNERFVIPSTVEECILTLEKEKERKEAFEREGIILPEDNNNDEEATMTMTSLEVVDLINKFREEEGNKVEKKHKTFMRDIRDEISALKKAGIEVQYNFVPYSYKAGNGKTNPCYKMNKAGIMQMLNKESALVRYKTQQYIEALENKIKTLSVPSYGINDPIARAEQWIMEKKREEYKLCLTRIDTLESALAKLTIVNDILTFDEFNKVANATVNAIVNVVEKSSHKDIWNNIWDFVKKSKKD